MRGFLWIFIVLLTATAAKAQPAEVKGQPPSRPRFDVNLNIGAFGGSGENATPHWNDWFYEGRYAASIGYYWTENLKTELEFATSGESTQYIQEFVRVPPSGQQFLLSMEQFHRLQQTSLRMTWQFFENTWVHPYVNGGIALDIDKSHYEVPPQYYSSRTLPRPFSPEFVRAELNSAKNNEYSVAGTIGAGAKIYFSPRTYMNAGVQSSWGEFKTITALAGFGVEF